MDKFELVSPYKPSGDQPKTIERITNGFLNGIKEQVLLGATGTGKTFTMASVISKLNRPTLVLSHNKTLAGQLYEEFKEFFPNNAVEYFVSYYDYYQPEAYVPSSDTYIEKDSSINDEIDQLRHSATSSLLERRDVIVVSSVSSIYGLGDPNEYKKNTIYLSVGQEIDRNKLLKLLVSLQFQRNNIDFQRGTFRVNGDIVEIFPSSQDNYAIRIDFFGDEIEKLSKINPLTGETISNLQDVRIFPSTHFMVNKERMNSALVEIKEELNERIKQLKKENKLLEAERLEQRTNYDIEMMQEVGYTSGIENYSRYLDGRIAGEPPHTLLDFFPKDKIIMVDESHVTIPQIQGMYNGDASRKQKLIDYGFRLPSALDNRPLTLDEFENHVGQILYISATPGPYELKRVNSEDVIEQIIRPTGLLDPEIEVRPVKNQIDNLVGEINKRVHNNERVFITTLTKKMAEDLTDYLKELGIKVKYLHSDIKTLERTKIINDLRSGEFHVLIGINLLREGIDVPEVSLVAILDADKEGFLRSERSLIQIIGRASRNANGKVIMYADVITDSMKKAIYETKRRREIQENYNSLHNIKPKTIIKPIRPNIIAEKDQNDRNNIKDLFSLNNINISKLSYKDKHNLISTLNKKMKFFVKQMKFEKAAEIRDILKQLK